MIRLLNFVINGLTKFRDKLQKKNDTPNNEWVKGYQNWRKKSYK